MVQFKNARKKSTSDIGQLSCAHKAKNMPPLSINELNVPPYTTSQLQPCDAGINRPFKAYHPRLLQNFVDGIVDPMKVDMLEAIKCALKPGIM